MTTVAAFAAIPFVFANAPFDANAGILASSAGALAIATLLALPASLAARLGRQVFLICRELTLEVDRRHGSLAGWGRTDHPGRSDSSSRNVSHDFLTTVGRRLDLARIGKCGSILATLARSCGCRLGATRFDSVAV